MSHVVWCTWTCGGVAHSFCTAIKAAFWIRETSPGLSDVERSVVLRSVFAIGSALTYLLFFREFATPPYVQVRHTTWLSFTRPSPALVLQATNAGAPREGLGTRLNTYHIPTHLYSLPFPSLPSPPPSHKGFSSGFSVASALIWQMCYPVLPTSVWYIILRSPN